jgi:hypothetical protein
MVTRWDRLNGPDEPPIEGRYVPVTVERAFRGVTTPVVYLTPAGVVNHLPPGRRYLVYGWDYHAPDIFMFLATGEGARPVETAAHELAWLNQLEWNGNDGVQIAGTLTFKDRSSDSPLNGTPIDGVSLRISGEGVGKDTVTDSAGRFSFANLPAGEYSIEPALPDTVTLWNDTDHHVSVLDGGCTDTRLVATINSRLSGRVTNLDGSPAITSVDVEPLDVAPDSVGHVRGRGSVSTDVDGRFEFSRLAPGRYLLGVHTYLAPRFQSGPYGVTYYPGTADRALAVPITVTAGAIQDGYDFSLNLRPPAGVVWVRVQAGSGGALTLCTRELDDAVAGRTTREVTTSHAYRLDVLEGSRYEIHAHRETPGGTLTSAPVVFTGATGQATIELQPDRPRHLH